MSGKKTVRIRNATIEEIAQRLQSVGDYRDQMIKHEADASVAASVIAAAVVKDFSDQKEAARRFARDFQSFLSTARTAWNYMIQASEVAHCRSWLDGRLCGNLFQFHRELANQDLHDHGIEFGVRQTIHWEADADVPWIRSQFGLLPAKMKVTGLGDMAYRYNAKELEASVAPLYESVSRKYSNETVVELAIRYHEGIRQVLTNAERNSRFV